MFINRNFKLDLFLIFFGLIQILFFLSIISFFYDLTFKRSILIIFCEILILLSFYIKKKNIILSITILTFFLLNFFTIFINFNSKNNLITLEPNLNIELTINNNTYNGISERGFLLTDSKGFRTTSKIDYVNKKKIRIFTIGGSTTEQILIDNHKTSSALFEEKLNKNIKNNYEVINTGVSGLILKHNFYTLKEVIQYEPDIAIFLVGINDWNGHIYKLNDSNYENIIFKISFQNTVFWKSLKQIIYFKNKKFLIQQKYFDGSYLNKQNDSLNRRIKKNIVPKTVSKNFNEYFDKISSLCETNNIICIISNQPNAYSKKTSLNMQKKFWMTPPNRGYTLDLESLIKISNIYNNWIALQKETENLKICNLSKKLESSEINFYDDVHFTEIGALNFSEELFKCVINKINIYGISQ